MFLTAHLLSDVVIDPTIASDVIKKLFPEHIVLKQ